MCNNRSPDRATQEPGSQDKESSTYDRQPYNNGNNMASKWSALSLYKYMSGVPEQSSIVSLNDIFRKKCDHTFDDDVDSKTDARDEHSNMDNTNNVNTALSNHNSNATPFDKQSLLDDLLVGAINCTISKDEIRTLLSSHNITVREYNDNIKSILRSRIELKSREEACRRSKVLVLEHVLDNAFLKEIARSRPSSSSSVTDREMFVNCFYKAGRIPSANDLLNTFLEKCSEEKVLYDHKDTQILEQAVHYHLRELMEGYHDRYKQ